MPGAITLGRVNPPDRPFAADRVLGWMAQHGDRLQAARLATQQLGHPGALLCGDCQDIRLPRLLPREFYARPGEEYECRDIFRCASD